MKKSILFSLVGLFGTTFSQAQEVMANTESTANRWTFGGGVGLSFGSNSYMSVGVSPRVGYLIKNQLEVGAMGNLTISSSSTYRSTLVGLGPFVNFYVAPSFFLGANFQHYFVNYNNKIFDYKDTSTESALYLGGGYNQRIGTHASMQIGLMYNVLWKENSSMFASGLVPSVGVVFGI